MGHLGGAAKCEISKELLSFLHGKRDAAAVESKIILSFIGNAQAQKVRHWRLDLRPNRASKTHTTTIQYQKTMSVVPNFHMTPYCPNFTEEMVFVQFQLELLNFFRAFLHGSGNRFHSFPSLVMEKSDRKFNSFSITLFHHSFPSLFSITLFHHCC